ncbi:hypothetical protein EC973_000746 [Apophysomyces ossiformis]|uniref:F-box domain-containing protein n=1 Tax=Apophysomyces ossiformis TaxID=679940 RepID=A0A8H7ESF3_9FUNG|nr:hypothetical protein EC973_000746 [Apophysomyces ossiformis]
MLQLFPLELIDTISKSLDSRDLYICMSVSKSWYPLFRIPLYKTKLSIRSSDELSRFIQTVDDSCLGKYVYHIDFRQVDLTLTNAQRLRRLCPNLQSVGFGMDKHSCIHESTMTMQFLENFTASHVTELHMTYGIECSCSEETSVDDSYMNSIIPCLKTLPQLVSLSLCDNAMLPKLGCVDIDNIHYHCPLLESLELNGINLGYFTVPSNIVPASKIRNIKIHHTGMIGSDCSVWLSYFAQKYPSLESVDLTSAGLLWAYTAQHLTLFARGCPRLKRARFGNIAWKYKVLYEVYSANTQLNEVILLPAADLVLPLPNLGFYNLIDVKGFGSLKSLTYTIAPSENFHITIQCFSRIRSLERLELLGCKSPNPEVAMVKVLDSTIRYPQGGWTFNRRRSSSKISYDAVDLV